MNQIINEEIEKISEIASYLWEKGWSERNAGNISFDFTGLINENEFNFSSSRFYKRELPPESAGSIIFVTGTGERLRDLKKYPEKAGCIIFIDKKANGYYLVWGGKSNSNFNPTSEFESHIAIHLFNRSLNNRHRCVVHTHPIELITLSHHPVLSYNEDKLNKSLWSMLPEIRVFVPRGIFLAPYTLPGSKRLADLTIEGLKYRDVVLWLKHGALASGKDAVEAFDFIDVANKGAIIYLKCLQAGYEPIGLSDNELNELEIFI